MIGRLVESWRPVVGHEGHYEVSSHGRVRSLDRVIERTNHHGTRSIHHKGRELKPSLDKQTGYLKIGLGFQSRTYSIHRIVLEAFVGPLPEGMLTRHLDGVKTNNRVENLMYGTYAENQIDEVELGTHWHTRKTKCDAGHEFSPENTARRVNPSNGRLRRVCRICERDRGSSYRARRRAKVAS